MKIIVFATLIFSATFHENVSGISIIDSPMCTLDLKICTEGQYLGTGPDGCPKCLQCPLSKIVCPDGITPVKGRKVDNQCPTHYCPTGLVRCTKEMKYCADGQYLGFGASRCHECLPCPVAVIRCPVGSTAIKNPAVLNKCATYSCTPRCVGGPGVA